jgi:hypothetical protein
VRYSVPTAPGSAHFSGASLAAQSLTAKVDQCLASFPPCDGFGNLALRQ